MEDRVFIFDTTLRDGEQSPGCSMNFEEKIRMARQIQLLCVDVIEAGFPISSVGDFESVRLIAEKIKTCTVAALARAVKADIDRAWEAIREAAKPRIHIFIATSDLHLKYKLKKSREQVLKDAIWAVQYAKSLCDDIEFSCEDASRSDIIYLCEIVEATIKAGATIINLPDTVGYAIPDEYGAMFRMIRERVPNIGSAVLSSHCHNDLGLAVANSIAAIQNGARQVECTINGIGERAGNASLEEIVMALKVRKDICNYYTDINVSEIYNTSRMVSGFTGMIVQPNKAIVGENAFAHESGIHQDGMLKNKQTYEIMTPESVGVNKTKIVLGRHSGRHGLKVRLNELGYHVTESEIKKVYEAFLELADKKKEVFDDDLRVLMGDEIFKEEELYELEYMHVNAGTNTIPTATVRIKTKENALQESSTGDGPVDAVFNAIERALGIKPTVESYNVRSVTSGRQALGESIIRIRSGENSFTGRGTSTDIIEASAKAFLQAINQYLIFTNTKIELTENGIAIK